MGTISDLLHDPAYIKVFKSTPAEQETDNEVDATFPFGKDLQNQWYPSELQVKQCYEHRQLVR